MVMYLDFRPGDPGSIPGVDGKYENKILNLLDYASRDSTTIADSPGKLDYPYDYRSPTI